MKRTIYYLNRFLQVSGSAAGTEELG